MMTIREATERDIPLILRFVQELAQYEDLGHEVTATPESMRIWLFEKRVAHVLFCCEDGTPVGFVVYFFNFSTWEGKAGLYIEDLYVRSGYRKKGYGKALVAEVARIARREGCARVEWVCLERNLAGKAFYGRIGAKPMEGWQLHRLSGQALDRFSAT